MKRAFLLFFACLCFCSVHAAYLRNVPMTLTQPDGTILQCFASGDEYFNYLHDGNGYTIMQHPKTGYYVYAEKREGKLVATNYIAGVTDPTSKGLEPYALISPEEWMAKRKAWEVPDEDHVNRANPNHGTLNNISIFIRFSDDGEFTNTFSSIDNMFNDVSTNAVSMRSYFRAASYGAIEIPTTFYPGHNGETIISYQDTYPRNYFQPYNASSNTNGYQDDDERRDREFALLERAVTYINNHYPIPSSLNIDYDNDGKVDNVCFIVRGNVGAWSSLLWPHKWSLYDRTVKINGKRVYTFNFQLADATSYFNTSTMCHEMNHSLGAPDLYHYYHGTSLTPVGGWDLMEHNAMPPQHCGAYMKMKYGHWIDNIPEITQPGTYTLHPISSSSPTNIAYKIRTNVSNQFYVLEYRDKSSLFESGLPGSGLLIYRINTTFDGNADYDPDNGIYDEIYLFRPGGSVTNDGKISNAYFSANVGRTEFNANTNPHPFFTDGTTDNNLVIYNITCAGSTISFTYGISGIGAPTDIVATALDEHTVSLTWNAVSGASSYNVYRNGEYVGNTSATTYIDSNLDYGQYSYYLISLDANQAMSYPSETVTVSLQPENAVIIGDGSTTTSDALPSYTYFNYSLSEQIYTSAELGDAGNITSIAFYNAGATKTRTFEFYLKNTTKSTFDSYTDWITVAESDKVYSGSVTMTANEWTTITFDTPFFYDGTSNVVLVADDNTGSYSSAPHMSCRVLEAPNQGLRVYTDENDYSPTSPPTDYDTYDNASRVSEKNQILLGFSPSQTFTKVITGYTANSKDKYYLIASPIGDVNPEVVQNMLSNDYDLYYFDQNPAIDPETGVGLEWINYETSTGINEDFGNLVSGKGYLYANSNTVTLSFVGTPYDGDGVVTLRKNGGTMEGWNLVGNPFGQTAYLNRDFYVMNDAGTEITAAERNSVEAMEGVFVVANNDNEMLTFSTTEPTKSATLALNLSQGSTSTPSTGSGAAVVDRVILRFGQGGMLPKIQMNRNSTKVYVPMNDADYAVVPAGEIGEMPINFKAEKNGMYSFSINNNDVDFGYLHLVDNITGDDVDLLSSNVYNFEARTSDYASRFKLVFVCGDADAEEDMFAYYADGEIRFVETLQDATLQIVDVMGRVVVSGGDVSGNVSTSGMTPGVYMLRLINGNNVKVQKIVVQ